MQRAFTRWMMTQGIRHLLLIVGSFLMVFPFLWMLTSSIKTKDELWQFPPVWWPHVAQWGNFAEAWHAAPFGQYMFNSGFTALVIVLLQLINTAMFAYALLYIRFPGKGAIFTTIMASYMLPVAVTYVPSYIILSKLGLLNSFSGLIISNAVSVFGIFLIRQSFLQISKEVVEAATIDGAGHWTVLWRILFPLNKSSFLTLGLISFVQMYNNYLWPSLITKTPDKYLITMGLRQFFIQEGAYGIKWPLIMAASSIAVLPLLILFFVAQRWFIKGIGGGSVKG